MFKKIAQWVRRMVRAVGSFIVRLFKPEVRRQETMEQYMKRKQKEKLAKGESQANRDLEDQFLARMKHHHDLAKLEADRGDQRRMRIVLSEEATRLHDKYQDANRAYLDTFDDEGADPAYLVWQNVLSDLMEYVHYLDSNVPQSSTPFEGEGGLEAAAV